MIRKMMVDLAFFIFIIMIFLCAFGVTIHGSMYDADTLNWSLIKKVFDTAYWPIHGDFKILEEIERKHCTSDDNECVIPNPLGSSLSYFALIIYVIIANILLLNLLIAMFR